MKLTVRIFALSVVIAGFAAASFSSSATHTHTVPSHQAVLAALPIAGCGPYCPK